MPHWDNCIYINPKPKHGYDTLKDDDGGLDDLDFQ